PDPPPPHSFPTRRSSDLRLAQDQTGRPSYHELNAIVSEIAEALRQLAPRRIDVSTRLAEGSFAVFLDAVELRRVLLNLALSMVRSEEHTSELQSPDHLVC